MVDACVASSTHYVDITGEATFVRKVIDKHHDTAVRKKLKVAILYTSVYILYKIQFLAYFLIYFVGNNLVN